jgi:opacity protein-like surface antigen
MRSRLVVSAVLALLMALPAAAQSSKADIFAGYSYLRFDSVSLGLPHDSSLNGWAASGTAYFYKPWLGAVADFSGNYGKKNGLAFNAYSFLGGPQLTLRRHGSGIFIRGLLGAARNTISGATDTGFEYGGGGGLDIGLRHHITIRAFQADYLKVRTFGVYQKNVRVSAGLVWHWGHK